MPNMVFLTALLFAIAFFCVEAFSNEVMCHGKEATAPTLCCLPPSPGMAKDQCHIRLFLNKAGQDVPPLF